MRGVRVEQRARRVLRLLHVRLVERVDLEQAACRGGRHLPPEEFGAERLDARHVDGHQRHARRAHPVDRGLVDADAVEAHGDRDAIRAGRRAGRLTGNRHDPLAMLAGALGNQLFDPEPERLETRRQQQRQLVAPLARGRAEQRAERDARIDARVRDAARVGHAARAIEQDGQRHADERGGNDPEQRQGRIAAADIGGVDEDVEVALVQRAAVKLGAVVGDGDEPRRPVLDAGRLDPPARRGCHRVGLDGRPRLARHDEERGGRPVERVAHGGGIRRVEHAEPRPHVVASKQPVEHLRRQARAAHAEQDDVGEGAGADALHERFDVRELRLHPVDRPEPPEAVRDGGLRGVIPAPEVGAPRPEGVYEALVIEL